MEWDDSVRTVPLNAANVGFMRSAPGYTKASPVITALNAVLPDEPCCFPAHLIPTDDEQTDGNQPQVTTVSEGEIENDLLWEATDEAPHGQTAQHGQAAPHGQTAPHGQHAAPHGQAPHGQTIPIYFNPDEIPIIVEHEDIEQEDATYSNDQSTRLLHWHYRLGHLPFKKLQAMAKQGILPPALAKCKAPQCSACLYGKATKRAWRTRATPSRVSPATITGPGDCVSVDQLESSTPGLIAQLRGFLTRKRYTVSTIFVDHYSRLSYVHLQQSTSAEDTLQAKRAFEAYAMSHGVRVKHYHADNGRFIERAFREHCEEKQQTISFSGVNAHFQNALAEKRIRDLQDSARTMLVHAKHRWP
jgi:hypothetical protein